MAAFLTQAGDDVRESKLQTGVALTYPGSLGPLPISWVQPGKMSSQGVRALLPWAITSPSQPAAGAGTPAGLSVHLRRGHQDALVAGGLYLRLGRATTGSATPLPTPNGRSAVASTSGGPPAGAEIVVATEADRTLGRLAFKATGDLRVHHFRERGN